jgi:short-chain Z-isoprenyl diphosphate synthase
MISDRDRVSPQSTAAVAATSDRPRGEESALRRGWRVAKTLIKEPFYRLYLHRLREQAHGWQCPRHIGLIMDGNRRFARLAGSTLLDGHHRGADKLQEVLDWCQRLEVRVVTVWCFSLDNFQRSASEVKGLLRLFEDKTRAMVHDDTLHQRGIRVRFIGEIERLPASLRKEIEKVEAATADYREFQLNIAMAYGGREEITEAFRRFFADRAASGDSVETILARLDASVIEPYLYTSGQPEPDLILRTSGEVRLSGFLLWQSAYSEYYFADACWPALREIDFLRALRAYHVRQRRFGR